ncbi:MAG: hypothetical protein VX951_06630 [Planctomycetota bacterium]|nr:hypothetical protein [Planctomycetota bacterium]
MHRLTSLFGLLFLWMSGCAGYGAELREFRVENHSAEDIFAEVVRYAGTRGFGADPTETDRTRRLYVSTWRGGGLPIMGRDGGRRVRFFAKIVPTNDGSGWQINYCFEQQRIGEAGRDLDPEDDDWEAAGQDVAKERDFQYWMAYTLRGSGVGTGVEKKAGNDR